MVDLPSPSPPQMAKDLRAGFGVQGTGFRVWGSGFQHSPHSASSCRHPCLPAKGLWGRD